MSSYRANVNGSWAGRDIGEGIDEMQSFFQNCYHLKDWTKNDPRVPRATAEVVEEFINASRPLALCGDICNAQKHLLLKKPRSSEDPTFGKKLYRVGVGNMHPTTIALEYEIQTSTGQLEAFDLATQCVEEWNRFLAEHSME